MPKFPPRNRFFCALFPFVFLLTACANPVESTEDIPIPSLAITPYQTKAPDLSGGGIQITTVAELGPLPSPTPLAHVVVVNDTLLGISLRYGVSLDALLAANPGVNPNFLTVGMEILVPQGRDGEVLSFATPTALPLEVGESNCYGTAAGELWCFFLVKNQQESIVENLSAEIQLFSSNGDLLATATADSPMTLLLPDQAIPLVAYWDFPPTNWDLSSGRLLSASQASSLEDRFVSANLINETATISSEALSALVQGNVEIEGQAGTVWILAVAYDDKENVIGVRRWEGEGEVDSFEFLVYSLGAAIERVDLQIEARP